VAVKCNGGRGRLQDKFELYVILRDLMVAHWVKGAQIEAIGGA
jgi:hypothetical protein